MIELERRIGASDADDVEAERARALAHPPVEACLQAVALVYAPALVHAAPMLRAATSTVNRTMGATMRHTMLSLGVALSLSGLLSACGGGSSGGSSGAAGATGSNDPCDALKDNPIANADFCAKQSGAIDCDLVSSDQKNDACGIAMKDPPAELMRSNTVKEFGGSGAPDVSCFEGDKYPEKPGTPQAVTVKGAAVIFSHGCESKNLSIEFYGVKRSGDADDGDLGTIIGQAVTTASDCSVDGVASEEDGCDPMRYECIYEYPGVPTETELVIKTSGDGWTALYDYNIFIPNAAVKAGVWTHDVRALASDDYGVISQAAIGAPITGGHGAIAGEVHDCADIRLINAVVEVNAPRKVLTYFGDDEEHPLPDLGRKATSSLGLYSALDVDPGQVSIAAIGQTKDGKVHGIGFLRLHVFPDSVSTITFRGMNPVLVP